MTDEIPLCSSREIVAALRRAGFVEKRTRGSHATYARPLGGRTFVTVVVLGKREVPRGTLKGIIALAGLTVAEFRSVLK